MSKEQLRELMREATDGLSADTDLAARAWRSRSERRRGPWLAVAASVASAATVVGLVFVLDRPDGEPNAAAPSDSAKVDRKDEPTPNTPRVTASDRRTARRFVAFAKDPDRAPDRVRFAPDGVAIGLDDEVVRTLKGEQVGRADAWKIRRAFWRGWSGPFSALSTLRRNGGVPLNTIAGGQGRCAMGRSQPPDRLDGLRRIAVEPRPVSSCMEWFEVALYVDKQSRIHAVTLDLWEP